MTEYAHNHPPRCCCALPADPVGRMTICPLCPKHGELAQLGNDNSPKTIQAHTGERIYACCAQLIGRPHTDYCPTTRPAPPADDCAHGYRATDTCPMCDAAPNPLGMTHEPDAHTDPHGDTHPLHQCHPDRCGMWATQAIQPATQTSTPHTQHRAPDDLAGHLRDAIDRAKARRQADQLTEDNKGQRWHETGPDEAHETWRCDPAKCGRTPLATPTPGQRTTCECPDPQHCTGCPNG